MQTRLLKFTSIVTVTCFILFQPVIAQVNPETVIVNELSDNQIQRIVKEIESRGLNLEQATQLAKARGASELQVEQITARIREVQLTGGTSAQIIDRTEITADAPTAVDTRQSVVSQIRSKIFGFHLFNQSNLTFEPSPNIPVPSDYVVGVGDEVLIQIWGESQQTYVLHVDKNGDIVVPDLGPIKIANINFKDAKSIILNRLTAIYSDMAGTNPGTFANVSINNLRSIKVNITGNVNLSGTYTLPATASVFNALYLSGGPDENGSFREIKLIRDNKVHAVIDVYDYLINGITSSNISLRDQDIIIIPPYTRRVETTGAFKINGIFELKAEEHIQDLLRYTGGFSEQASKSRVLVTRFTENQYELTEIKANEFGTYPLRNGDNILAESIIERFENRLTIEGAVFRPGTYSLEEGMRLSNLIEKAGGLREDYYPDRGLIIRLDDQLYPTIIPFSLDDILTGSQNPTLRREDHVFIQDIFSMGERKTIRIYGEVLRPGEFEFRKNMTLKDLIFLSGGLTEAASQSYIEIARRNSYEEAQEISEKLVSLFQFNISRDLQLSNENNEFMLEPFDQVYIRRAPSYVVQRTVTIDGEVKYPGAYSIKDKNERISDLLERAGGLTPNAFPEGARLRRLIDRQTRQQFRRIATVEDQMGADVSLATDQEYKIMELRLAEIIKNPNSTDNFLLREGDGIYIPVQSEEIIVNGEVLNPAGLAWQSGRSVKYYINRSGGFSSAAKKNKIYVIYSNGTTDVTRSFIFKNYPTVKPGSQIVVPAKPEREKIATGTWLSIASTFASIALVISTILR